MTGYLFKNAEYRLSLQQSLGGFADTENPTDGKLLLSGDPSKKEKEEIDPLSGKVKGKIRVRYRAKNDNNNENAKAKGGKEGDKDDEEEEEEEDEAIPKGVEMEVDAAAYMSELRSEVSQLRDELMLTRKEKEESLRKDLLVYIRTLPEKELRELSGTMSPDVLVAMKGLVNAVMSGIGEGQIGPDTVTEQSGEAMAQLCMWQLVVGYNLRTLEVREEMKKSLTGGLPYNNRPESGVDADESPGAFE
uniref:Uncharacterized protein n=2 Tax=Amphora coffeiformis TaxID=265554 RepID=A0A7S3L0Z7_9STRA